MEFFEVARWVGFGYLLLSAFGIVVGWVVDAVSHYKRRHYVAPTTGALLKGPSDMLRAFPSAAELKGDRGIA